MIEYNKGYLGLPSLCYWFGSVLPRCSIPAITSAALTWLVRYVGIVTQGLNEENFESEFSVYGQGAFQSLNTFVAFVVIYRAQQAYSRFVHSTLELK